MSSVADSIQENHDHDLSRLADDGCPHESLPWEMTLTEDEVRRLEEIMATGAGKMKIVPKAL